MLTALAREGTGWYPLALSASTPAISRAMAPPQTLHRPRGSGVQHAQAADAAPGGVRRDCQAPAAAQLVSKPCTIAVRIR